MKAIIRTKSGKPDVLKLKDVDVPVPKENEILVKVCASSVTIGDVHLRKMPKLLLAPIGLIFGFKEMKITGVEFAGIVEDTGKNVTRFKKGDEIFGTTTGLKYGANAEYVCIPESSKMNAVAIKPAALSFEEAAVLPVGGMTALHILNKSDIGKGQKVLIHGASGSVGTYAVQIAKHLGAEVTGVCSTNNLELVKSIGADEVIDYTKTDFRKNSKKYDIIFDAAGYITKYDSRNSLKENGKYLTVKLPTKEKVEYLNLLAKLAEEGKIKPVIDCTYLLKDVVEAHKYVETKRKRGNVAVSILNEISVN